MNHREKEEIPQGMRINREVVTSANTESDKC